MLLYSRQLARVVLRITAAHTYLGYDAKALKVQCFASCQCDCNAAVNRVQ